MRGHVGENSGDLFCPGMEYVDRMEQRRPFSSGFGQWSGGKFNRRSLAVLVDIAFFYLFLIHCIRPSRRFVYSYNHQMVVCNSCLSGLFLLQTFSRHFFITAPRQLSSFAGGQWGEWCLPSSNNAPETETIKESA